MNIFSGRFLGVGVLSTANMLKPTVTCIFVLSTAILVVAHYYVSDQKDLMILVAGVTAIGATMSAGVDIWDRWKSSSARRKKRLREIPENFKANFHDGLISLEIILSKSELTYDRIYELSQDTRVMKLLAEHELAGLRDELEKFAELYKSGR